MVLPSGRGFGLSRPPSCISSKEKDTLWTCRESDRLLGHETGSIFTFYSSHTQPKVYIHTHTHREAKVGKYKSYNSTQLLADKGTQTLVAKSHNTLG